MISSVQIRTQIQLKSLLSFAKIFWLGLDEFEPAPFRSFPAFPLELIKSKFPLQLAVKIFTDFRELFTKTRRKIRGDTGGQTTTSAANTRSNTPAIRSVTPNGSNIEWDFPSSMIFARADQFAKRLGQLKVSY